MPRRLVVCFDGTWNTPDKDGNLHNEIDEATNVIHIFRAIKGKNYGTGVAGCTTGKPAVPPLKWYDTGVGTKRAAGKTQLFAKADTGQNSLL